jgi:glyceraldehyde-3-phosphate dehydrogenase (NADP+)
MDRPTGDRMVSDDRFKLLSFTGSPSVGWKMKAEAGKKKVVLELGGNAGAIVDETADLDWAVNRLVFGAFAYAGQVCISVQRVYVQRSIWDRFLELVIPKVQALRTGDPLDETTDIGPMIDSGAADRFEAWVDEALAGGARALVRGRREGNTISPTVLVDVRRDMKVCAREVFAPIINLFPYEDFGEAVREVDNSIYGLQAGVFTRDIRRIWQAFEGIEVGGLMVNEVPSWRIDHMP